MKTVKPRASSAALSARASAWASLKRKEMKILYVPTNLLPDLHVNVFQMRDECVPLRAILGGTVHVFGGVA